MLATTSLMAKKHDPVQWNHSFVNVAWIGLHPLKLNPKKKMPSRTHVMQLGSHRQDSVIRPIALRPHLSMSLPN